MAATAPPSFPARLAMAAIAAAIAWALYLARHGLVLVYVSVLLAVAMSPLVRLVERRALRPIGRFRLPRPLAILVVYLTVLGALVGLGFVLAPPIATQAQAFWAALPGLLDQLQGFLLRHGVIGQRLGWQEVFRRAPTLDLVGTLQATLGQFVGGLFGAVVIVFLTFYLLVESQTLFEEALRFCPAERREEVRAASVEVTRKVSGWLAGHLILGGIMGGTTALVLGLMGIPYFWVLAILSFVGELVPYFGAILSFGVGVGVALSLSVGHALGVAVFYLVLQQVENHVLVPQIFERQVGLSAVSVIVAIVIGQSLLGILGIILAVPSAAILEVVVERLLLRRRP
ncbi:MAG TPA: AI-2E family transporter [Candidatus Binatia bacterium]|nr:AI-2E family transporter [Candidatus Binatia bacterium]